MKMRVSKASRRQGYRIFAAVAIIVMATVGWYIFVAMPGDGNPAANAAMAAVFGFFMSLIVGRWLVYWILPAPYISLIPMERDGAGILIENHDAWDLIDAKVVLEVLVSPALRPGEGTPKQRKHITIAIGCLAGQRDDDVPRSRLLPLGAEADWDAGKGECLLVTVSGVHAVFGTRQSTTRMFVYHPRTAFQLAPAPLLAQEA